MGIVVPTSEGCSSSNMSEVCEARAQYIARLGVSSCLLLLILAKACWFIKMGVVGLGGMGTLKGSRKHAGREDESQLLESQKPNQGSWPG